LDNRVTDITKLGIKIFADGADLDAIRNAPPFIKGFTTNPSICRKAGVTDYKAFCLAAAEAAHGLPISFEVFADDLPGMAAQAREIASWGENVYVKIPVMNTEGKSTAPVIADLSYGGIKVNVTAVMTASQVGDVAGALCRGVASIVSVFAGRVADTGRDPMPLMTDAKKELSRVSAPMLFAESESRTELLWASPRETLNVFQADGVCDIITLPADLIAKLPLNRRNLYDYSRETVEMFRRDALAAGYEIPLSGRAAA
jgi:transaldolase